VALLNRLELYKRLSKNKVTVAFKKMNGDERVMVCTLDQDLFPATFDVHNWVALEEMKKPMDSGRMNVWDLEANGWRAFHIDRVSWIMTHDD
jgi:hypothetical protein